MSNFETIKYKLRDVIIKAVADEIPAYRIFFATERYVMPEKPYIMITELTNEEDLSSGRNHPNNKTLEITEYKNSIFTIAIYGVSDVDLSKDNNLFRNILNKIRIAFEVYRFNHFLKNVFTIKSLTDLRPLSDISGEDTGFTYRYEFDITLGYNDIITAEMEQSKGVIIDLENNNIHIEVNKENLDD